MKKHDLLKEVVNKAENQYTQAEIDEILITYAEIVADKLRMSDEKVPLSDLGSFTVKHVPEKSGVVAATGKAWTKPAHKEIVFKTSVRYKDI